MQQVLITDYAWDDLEIEQEILAGAGAQLLVAPEGDSGWLLEQAPEAHAIMTCWAPVRAEAIRAAKNCRIISRLGVGLDNIDVAVATECGIAVTNVPDYCADEVAEHALAMLMSMARNVAYFHHATKQGEYDLLAPGPMRRISGQTLGIVGFGHTGQILARRAGGLGMNVLVHSRSRPDPALLGEAKFCSLEDLLANSDYVSLHLPLTDASRHMINAQRLAQMKPSARVINTARGGLIDHAALWETLEANRLGGAALDVHDPEPPDLDAPLYRDPRVIATPHSAFSSVESLMSLRNKAAQQVADCLAGRTPMHVVNPAVLDPASGD
jgi:D-3-phosphoglycerate dehydrogenase